MFIYWRPSQIQVNVNMYMKRMGEEVESFIAKSSDRSDKNGPESTCFCSVLPTSQSHPDDPPFWLGLKEYDPDQRLLALLGAFDFFATGGSKEAAGFCLVGKLRHVESVE